MAFTEFATILLLLFMFWYSGYEACKILAPQPGMEPTSSALEAEVLNTGPPWKFHEWDSFERPC